VPAITAMVMSHLLTGTWLFGVAMEFRVSLENKAVGATRWVALFGL
jgi:hypothetical protein